MAASRRSSPGIASSRQAARARSTSACARPRSLARARRASIAAWSPAACAAHPAAPVARERSSASANASSAASQSSTTVASRPRCRPRLPQQAQPRSSTGWRFANGASSGRSHAAASASSRTAHASASITPTLRPSRRGSAAAPARTASPARAAPRARRGRRPPRPRRPHAPAGMARRERRQHVPVRLAGRAAQQRRHQPLRRVRLVDARVEAQPLATGALDEPLALGQPAREQRARPLEHRRVPGEPAVAQLVREAHARLELGVGLLDLPQLEHVREAVDVAPEPALGAAGRVRQPHALGRCGQPLADALGGRGDVGHPAQHAASVSGSPSRRAIATASASSRSRRSGSASGSSRAASRPSTDARTGSSSVGSAARASSSSSTASWSTTP